MSKKFKVGDRVRVKPEYEHIEDGLVGHTGYIDGREGGLWRADLGDHGPGLFFPTELELVEEPVADEVNSPKHYTWLNGIEVIDITEALNFCMGNAVKYIMRADHKGKPIEDLKKAAWYLEREIQRREAKS